MKFAIFGDSFVDAMYFAKDRNVYDYRYHLWATRLAEKLGATSIEYYGAGGSSFYYSYKKILEEGHKYDRIIFSVTEPARFPTKVHDVWCPNLGTLQFANFDAADKKRVEAWFEITPDTYLEDIQEAFLHHLESLFPNIILVPNFSHSFNKDRQYRGGLFESHKWNLMSFCIKMMNILNKGQFAMKYDLNGPGKILCHIPWVWHEPLTEMIYNHIVHNEKLELPVWPLDNKNLWNYFHNDDFL
jgi:hypothetical protein